MPSDPNAKHAPTDASVPIRSPASNVRADANEAASCSTRGPADGAPDSSSLPSRQAEQPEPVSNRLLTVPNVLCAVRLAGAPVLIGLALADRPRAFLWLFVFLAMTDWVDGKLAILLNQRSVFGARLDSWADASLYTALLFGGLWLHGNVLRFEWPWVAAAVVTYAASTLAGFAKFGRWPSYHTRMAKTSWLLITVGAVSVLGGWSLWPLRAAMLSVTITNLEALAITLVADHWMADVSSLRRVLAQRRKPQSEAAVTVAAGAAGDRKQLAPDAEQGDAAS